MTEIDAIRVEFRQDRVDMQRLIIDRFDKLDEKIACMAKVNADVAVDIRAVAANAEVRLGIIETRQNTFGGVEKGLWALFVAFVGGALSYGFSLIP